MLEPATVLLGCTVNVSCVAAPGMTSNEPLVIPVKPALDAASVYPVAAESILRFENVATPDDALEVAVPPSDPPPGLLAIATIMEAAEEVTTLPLASCTAT